MTEQTDRTYIYPKASNLLFEKSGNRGTHSSLKYHGSNTAYGEGEQSLLSRITMLEDVYALYTSKKRMYTCMKERNLDNHFC